MISDAKSLRISDIHIDVRAWEGKACNIVIRSFLRQRRFSVGTATSQSAIHRYAMTKRSRPISGDASTTRAKPAFFEMLSSSAKV